MSKTYTRTPNPRHLPDNVVAGHRWSALGFQVAGVEGRQKIVDLLRTSPSGVYFLTGKTSRMTKIGKAKSVIDRVNDIQNMNGEILFLDGVILTDTPAEVESRLHDSLRAFRHHGEWFLMNDRMIGRIFRNNDAVIVNESIRDLNELKRSITRDQRYIDLADDVRRINTNILVACVACNRVFVTDEYRFLKRGKRYCSRACHANVKARHGRSVTVAQQPLGDAA